MNKESNHPRPPLDPLPLVYWGLFAILVAIGLLWMARKPEPTATVAVLNSAVPAYHVIASGDVTTKTLATQGLPTDAVSDPQSLVGRYTREAISAEKPIRQGQTTKVSDLSLISGTLAVAIPATNAMILGGNVRPGDAVMLATVPMSDTAAEPAIISKAVLVLDVKTLEKETIVVLAIPGDRYSDFLAKSRNATVILARKVE